MVRFCRCGESTTARSWTEASDTSSAPRASRALPERARGTSLVSMHLKGRAAGEVVRRRPEVGRAHCPHETRQSFDVPKLIFDFCRFDTRVESPGKEEWGSSGPGPLCRGRHVLGPSTNSLLFFWSCTMAEILLLYRPSFNLQALHIVVQLKQSTMCIKFCECRPLIHAQSKRVKRC